MKRQTKEYDLAELIDNPGLKLALEYDGAEHNLLSLLFEAARRNTRRPTEWLEPPFAG